MFDSFHFLGCRKTDEKLMDSLSYSWINSAHFVIELVLVDVLRKNKKPTRMPQLTYLSWWITREPNCVVNHQCNHWLLSLFSSGLDYMPFYFNLFIKPTISKNSSFLTTPKQMKKVSQVLLYCHKSFWVIHGTFVNCLVELPQRSRTGNFGKWMYFWSFSQQSRV